VLKKLPILGVAFTRTLLAPTTTAQPTVKLSADKQFAKAVQDCVAHKLEPIIIASAKPQVLLLTPPKIAEFVPDATLQQPPTTVEYTPFAQFTAPPPMNPKQQDLLFLPPPMKE
jgi:hypothetical protein